jgi:hypothetical protein
MRTEVRVPRVHVHPRRPAVSGDPKTLRTEESNAADPARAASVVAPDGKLDQPDLDNPVKGTGTAQLSPPTETLKSGGAIGLLLEPMSDDEIAEADAAIEKVLKDFVPHPEYLKGYEDGLERAMFAMRDARNFDGQSLMEDIIAALHRG